MKVAVSTDGRRIEAKESAPSQALCPYCGGKTVLRKRRQMGKDRQTYFWRHQDNRNLSCPARRNVVGF